jgi:hypothetical protein
VVIEQPDIVGQHADLELIDDRRLPRHGKSEDGEEEDGDGKSTGRSQALQIRSYWSNNSRDKLPDLATIGNSALAVAGAEQIDRILEILCTLSHHQ